MSGAVCGCDSVPGGLHRITCPAAAADRLRYVMVDVDGDLLYPDDAEDAAELLEHGALPLNPGAFCAMFGDVAGVEPSAC